MNHPDHEGATIEDVGQAYESLTNDELYRLHKLARVLLAGTEYSDPQDLLNETLVRTLRAANGEKGRHWPKSVDGFNRWMQHTECCRDQQECCR